MLLSSVPRRLLLFRQAPAVPLSSRLPRLQIGVVRQLAPTDFFSQGQAHFASAGERANLNAPASSYDEPSLVSWVDPLSMSLNDMDSELPEDKETLSIEHQMSDDFDKLAAMIIQVHGRPNLALGSLLSRLGVRSPADIKYVTEQDLTSNGIAVITARRFLGRASKSFEPFKGEKANAVATAAATGNFSAEDTMKFLAKKGVLSANRTGSQIFASSFLGGALLGWGCALTTVVAGGSAAALAGSPGILALLTGMVFPVGLSMVVLSGSELLTGNFTTLALPVWTHPGLSRAQVFLNTWRVWGISGAGNLAGSVFLACALYSLSVISAGSPCSAWLMALTVKKCSLGPLVAIGKGAGANWLVNVAIFQASSAHTTAGKIASLWMPIMTFVVLGLEHSIANMFLLPLGWLCGADVSMLSIAGNIIPVAVGNALGAITFVAGVQRYSLLRNLVYAK